MKTILQVVVVLGVSLLTAVATGQDRRYGDRSRGGGPPGGDRSYGGDRRGGPPGSLGGGSPGGGGPPGGGQISEEQMKSGLDKMESFLKTMDKNGNGSIEEDEVSDGQKRMLQFIASRGGQELKFPVSIVQARKTAEDGYRARAAGGSMGGPGGPGGSMGGPGGPGGPMGRYGGPPGGMRPGMPPSSGSGFGPPSGAAPPSSSSSGSSNSSRYSDEQMAPFLQLDSQTQQQIRDLAAAIMRKFDKNRDERLDRDEWPGTSRSGSFDEANRTGGRSISMEELLVHLADYYKRGQLPTELADGSPSASSTTSRSGASAAAKPKSGRFLTAAERLPKGTPDWFRRLDRDEDGQITMAEFSNDWTRERAAEFDRYDLNHDGIITAEECLKMERPSR